MPKKKAIIVAINGYPPPNALPSCVADGEAFARHLQDIRGFTEIRKLFDGEATIKNVEKELAWLTTNATQEDSLVFYCSSHGYSKADGASVEEYIVLLDEEGNPALWRDDNIVAASERVPEGVFTAICDCCFSGGMTKMVFEANGAVAAKVKMFQPTTEQLTKEFSLLPPTNGKTGTRVVSHRKLGRASEMTGAPKALRLTTKAVEDPSEASQPEFNGVVMMACSEDETAAASTPATGGLSAFTCMLLETVARVPAEASIQDVIAATSTSLKSAGFRQTCSAWARKDSGLLDRAFLGEPMAQAQTSRAAANHESPLSPAIRALGNGFNQQQNKKKEETMATIDIQSALPILNELLQVLSAEQGRNGGNHKRKDISTIAPTLGEADEKFLAILPAILPLVPTFIDVAMRLGSKKKDLSVENDELASPDKAFADVVAALFRAAPSLLRSVSTAARA